MKTLAVALTYLAIAADASIELDVEWTESRQPVRGPWPDTLAHRLETQHDQDEDDDLAEPRESPRPIGPPRLRRLGITLG